MGVCLFVCVHIYIYVCVCVCVCVCVREREREREREYVSSVMLSYFLSSNIKKNAIETQKSKHIEILKPQ